MGYELQVSEVGPAEYPLMEVLRDTIFGELGHVHHSRLADDLQGREDVFALIAHLEGNPVGYKIGYRFNPGVFYSKSGGVLKEYRRNGLGRQMQQWQHGWLRARGYRSVFFNSFNRFTGMIRLGLESGFVPIGMERRDVGECSIEFLKDLTAADPARPVVKVEPDVRAEVVGPELHHLIGAMASLGADHTAEEQVAAELARPGSTATVVSLNSKPVGFAIGHVTHDRVFVTTHFEIVESYRYRGAEAALARRQLQTASEHGCAVARWEARHDDVNALLSAVDAGYQFVGMRHPVAQQSTVFALEQLVQPGTSVR